MTRAQLEDLRTFNAETAHSEAYVVDFCFSTFRDQVLPQITHSESPISAPNARSFCKRASSQAKPVVH